MLNKELAMLLFEHMGITLGTIILINNVSNLKLKLYILENNDISAESERDNNIDQPTKKAKIKLFDLIFCLIGSILPDLIDKPIGHYLFSETFGNSAGFSRIR